MKSHYRVVIIGGGIVGSSILYHLSKFGWTDVALIERAELTAGSTWHAAAGFHALNDDPNIAALQGYTIRLYEEIEKESGQSVGMHMTGGISLAATPERWEMLKAERAMYETMEMETRLVTPEEIKELCPIVDVANLQGGLYDQHQVAADFLEREGVDPAQVRLVPPGGSTAEEAGVFAALAHRCGWQSAIVVTSPFHTRRAGWLPPRAGPAGFAR